MRRKGHELDLIINLIDSLEVHLGLGSLKILDLFDAAARRAGEEKDRKVSSRSPLPSRARPFDVDLRSTAHTDPATLSELRIRRTFFPTSSLTFLSSSKIFPLFPFVSACCPRSPSSSALSWLRRVASGEPDPEVGELVARAILFLISF